MEIEGLHTQIEKFQTENMDTKLRVEQLEASRDSLEKALATEGNTHRALLDASHADKKSIIAAHEKEITKMRNILQTKLEKVQTENMDMKVRIERLEASKASLEEALATKETSHRTSLDASNADKKILIAAHETEAANLRKTLTIKEKAHEQLEARVVGLELEKVDKDKTIEELNAENENFEESLAVEQDRCRHLQGRINAKLLEKKAWATEHESLSRKIEDLNDSLTMSQDYLNHKEVVIAAYEAANTRKWQEHIAAEMERDSLLNEYRKELNARKEVRSPLPTFSVRTLN